MRIILRLLAGILFVATISLAVIDIALSIAHTTIETTSLFDLWSYFSPESLIGFGNYITDNFSDQLWDTWLVFVFRQPAWLLFLLGSLLFYLCGYRRPNHLDED